MTSNYRLNEQEISIKKLCDNTSGRKSAHFGEKDCFVKEMRILK